jgi:nucleoside recognition membrane protein YjiH
MAGLARRYLIRPPSMIWPNILSFVALFLSFHQQNRVHGRMSRYTFFWAAALACFVYSWIPQFLIGVLQSFSILCVFGNRLLSFLASSGNGFGVGLGALTLDWYYIGGESLTTPW